MSSTSANSNLHFAPPSPQGARDRSRRNSYSSKHNDPDYSYVTFVGLKFPNKKTQLFHVTSDSL